MIGSCSVDLGLGVRLVLCSFGVAHEMSQLTCGGKKGVGGIIPSCSTCISGDHPSLMSVMVAEVFMEVGRDVGALADDLGIVASCSISVGGGR